LDGLCFIFLGCFITNTESETAVSSYCKIIETAISMNAVRRRKLMGILCSLAILAIVIALVTYALRQNISLFYTPSQVHEQRPPLFQKIRLGGMVEKGSLQRSVGDLSVQFRVTDFKHSLLVHYRGILPDLFREGQGIVVFGSFNGQQAFNASEVLAKHDANYMPPEVKSALNLPKPSSIRKTS
jgi:cytochrome c-type biogenesis protein CcmE